MTIGRCLSAVTDRPDVLKRRQDGFDGQPDLDPESSVFHDETWASINMARRHGRCGAANG